MSETHHYLIAIGSNVRHPKVGNPRAVVRFTIAALEDAGLYFEAASSIVDSRPVGPSRRAYANAVVRVKTDLEPERLLRLLQDIESSAGRVRRGQPWRARVLDLDIILWDGGAYSSPDLQIPHPLFRERDFVLHPAAQIAPGWRDPVTGRTLRQLAARR
ncbi:2-amino-4-hydroxy-6-hydroxymethyldihydropteridine diphosphokinase [Aurantiacibacter aquimixticola]|uniref:2-amino-4-hydroxy-6-hydroxymethyldihydropteridine pyrophosphokinase n=1 Tax=Aurantiacibacter aquimixticola TaxID=1958945 RepID=A0A419RVI6_9SPHN|nr:2-amino-4-hydroxy-6-hydroxymethyldihydropteridine diphosphokinase [Aurantiacibacter aquimixticola]RJY09805.1 2-amino-4-hydroxy-6-hydroxymethyldihydropteridine diphosphokinase [Aurantiacibacter aquimixticola]